MTDFMSIEPSDFIRKYDAGELKQSLVIDVREPVEWEYYHLEHTEHMPMQTIPARLSELPDDIDIYIVCAHGVRSAAVCDYLARNGFGNAVNVEGGMAAVSGLRGFQYD
ncbi:rhodanese-like domain-containing protein [Paenibacillus thalictri]|uniref:Rhodanese-like domain-containing protein n=1 Tax=Paenibacillus thalictri TaxID=2527873 RepID=A0A4V2J4G8_9BACL|nr:rhodanese-like domain-containing protein [Paenibacillus thalictri]TBL79782.1 rhodanese-like domain-containing protein [Paenibacillus thalictri]